MDKKTTWIAGLILFILGSCVQQTTFYVSPNGDDSQQGTSVDRCFM